MRRPTSVDLTKLVEDFVQLEHKITEMKGENCVLEIQLDETKRLLKLAQNTEKQLTEERDELLENVESLQQTLQQQCEIRVENEQLKSAALQMKKESEDQLEEGAARLRMLCAEVRALKEQHQRELKDCEDEAQQKLDAMEFEMNAALERKECDLEGLQRQLKEKETEKQSQIIKLQMEFGTKLARAQSVKSQAQTPHSTPLPQNIFKRKLQFIQDEKNKEIEALRQRVKDLEQHSRFPVMESRLKRKKH